MEPIQTERLTVRRMAESDLQDFLAYQTHPETLKYQPVEALTAERATRFLSRMAGIEVGDEGGYRGLTVEL